MANPPRVDLTHAVREMSRLFSERIDKFQKELREYLATHLEPAVEIVSMPKEPTAEGVNVVDREGDRYVSFKNNNGFLRWRLDRPNHHGTWTWPALLNAWGPLTYPYEPDYTLADVSDPVEQSTRQESDYGGMPRGGSGDDLPGPEDVACLKCGSYAIDHESGPHRAFQFCPTAPAVEQSQRPEWLPDDAELLIGDYIKPITRWYNESAYGRQLVDGYATALEDLTHDYGRQSKRLKKARAERSNLQERLTRVDGYYAVASKACAATQDERDKAIKERNAFRGDLSQKVQECGRVRAELRRQQRRAEAAEANVAAMETKLHLDEEAGMDNVRRMERAEAKVARVEAALRNAASYGRYMFENAVIKIDAIRKALDSEQ